MSRPSAIGVVAGAIFLSVLRVAAAQTPVHTFADLEPLLKPKQTIIVTDGKGEKISVPYLSIRGAELEVGYKKQQLVFTESTVRRIQKNDTNFDGTLIGGAIGIVLGVISSKSANQIEGEEILDGVVLPLGGAYLGNLVDSLMHKTLFMAAPKSRVAVAPLAGRARAGIAVMIRY